MNRRQFLTGTSALAVSAAMPAVPVATIVEELVSIPPVALPLYQSLCDVTRKAFVPRLFVQIHFATPIRIADWYEAREEA